MKKIFTIISGFIIAFIFIMLIDKNILTNVENTTFKVIIYLVSLYASAYYFVVRHLVE